jgi:hypothetical protein
MQFFHTQVAFEVDSSSSHILWLGSMGMGNFHIVAQ